MALYSFSHSGLAVADGLGKTGARLTYVCCRQGAVLLGERHGLPAMSRPHLARLAAEREAAAGRNGRIAECFIAALPREGTRDQHAAIVRQFAERLTHGEAPWIGAIHYDKPGNPHVHIVALDQNRPQPPGKRGRPTKVIGMSRNGALEESRALWSEVHNEVMAGTCAAIDHRSLVAQGQAERVPTIHEGPASRAMRDKGLRPQSRAKTDANGRTIDWPSIDEGATRAEVNELVTSINILTATLKESEHGRPDGVSIAAATEHRQGPGGDAGSLPLDPERPGERGQAARPGRRPADQNRVPGEGDGDRPTAAAIRAALLVATPRGPSQPGGGVDGDRHGDGEHRHAGPPGRPYAPSRLRAVERGLRDLIALAGTGLRAGLGRLFGKVDWTAMPSRPPKAPLPWTLPRRPAVVRPARQQER